MRINITKTARILYNENYMDVETCKPWTGKQIIVSRLLEVKDCIDTGMEELHQTLDEVIKMIEGGK